jgi:hypothetical protein
VFGRTGVVGAQPGDYTAAQVGALAIASDLSDLNSPSIARTNLGLGSLATKSSLLAADIPNLDAAKITTGVFGDSQIPASIARDSEVQSAVSAKIDATEKGAAGGVATLDGTGKVPTAQLPELGAVQSVFGRIGAVEAELGDYDTDQVVEGATNLYFTAARSRNALAAIGPLAYNATTGTFSVPNTRTGDLDHCTNRFTISPVEQQPLAMGATDRNCFIRKYHRLNGDWAIAAKCG